MTPRPLLQRGAPSISVLGVHLVVGDLRGDTNEDEGDQQDTPEVKAEYLATVNGFKNWLFREENSFKNGKT